MSFIAQSASSITQALQELRVNKLRTFLSLMGITIGIFCIISVLTALDSARGMIQKNVETLGTDVLYVGRWPWPGSEDGEFKWWEYWRRPSMSKTELNAVENQLGNVAMATLCLPLRTTAKYEGNELNEVRAYAINTGFDKVQNIELAQGRYLSLAELEGGNNTVIIGDEINKSLFNGARSTTGKFMSLMGKKYLIVGVMKKTGMNMADFDFDNGVLIPYNSIVSLVDVRSLQYQPRLIIKPFRASNSLEIKDEVIGILRRLHRIRPEQGNDFAVNQLSGFSKMLDEMFVKIDIGGLIIGGFSLLVGAFGIANIMFVTVKERTKIIGLKKAIGARRISIMMEFLLESVVLCVIGGLIGIIIVLLLSMAVSRAMDINIVLSLKNFLVGIFVSVFVGILSGFIPARAASRLDPVVAIRTH